MAEGSLNTDPLRGRIEALLSLPPPLCVRAWFGGPGLPSVSVSASGIRCTESVPVRIT